MAAAQAIPSSSENDAAATARLPTNRKQVFILLFVVATFLWSLVAQSGRGPGVVVLRDVQSGTVLRRDPPVVVLQSVNGTVNNVSFPKESYRAKSAPVVLPGGSVSLLATPKASWLVYGGMECSGSICPEMPEQAEKQQRVVEIEGDVIVIFLSQHYFHFVYDTMLRIYPLALHGMLERYPGATVLCFPTLPNTLNIDMMKALRFPLPLNNLKKGVKGTLYKVNEHSTMILPRHNDYHNKVGFKPYNVWLMDSMRRTLNITENPQEELFLSRRGHRRGIAREDELFAALQTSILPNLRNILPDDFTVAEQAVLFSNAKLIISPHGAGLTNVIFSSWNQLVLIEFSPANNDGNFATFRNDLQVKQHYLLKCESVPCAGAAKIKAEITGGNQCDPWDRQIDVDVVHAVDVIKSILFGDKPEQVDFVMQRSNETLSG